MSYFESTKAAGTTVQITFDDPNATPRFGLGYWSIRGLGAPLTMMLCAAKTPFTLFLYDIIEQEGSDGGWTSDYFAAKPDYIKDYDTPLWNLPFCVDRENKHVICQTNAVFAYIGRECGMLGDGGVSGADSKTASQCEQLLCEMYDLRNVMTDYAYGPPGTEPGQVLGNAKKHFNKLEAWLNIEAAVSVVAAAAAAAESKKAKVQVVHLVGGTFSAPDFHLYEMLDQFSEFAKLHELGDLFNDYPRLKDFKEGFAALE
jgi:hypothetical protein